MAEKNADLHGFVPDRAATALLIIDLISDYGFEDGEAVLRAALPVAQRVRRLKQRARAAGIPAIYVNDNFGRWRSDFRQLVRHAERSRGADVVRCIEPDADDYFILKPKHSGFFATALETLLTYLRADTVIVTGVSAHQCVLFTANDAYVRDLRIIVPSDCVGAVDRGQKQFALRYFRTVLKATVCPSARVRFARRAEYARRGTTRHAPRRSSADRRALPRVHEPSGRNARGRSAAGHTQAANR